MADKITQDIYEKISDDVFTLGRNVVLRFNVSLSYKDKEGNRVHYHKEYKYQSKYRGVESLITLRRSFDYYLTIENVYKDDNGNKEFIRLGACEIIKFKIFLQNAINWFNDTKYSSLYAIKDNKLVMMGRPENLILNELPMEKYLVLEAIVCVYEKKSFPGVRLYLSSDGNFVDMSLDRLMGLYYSISTFNLYQSGQLMLNYVQRPEFGTNIVDFSTQEYNPFEPSVEGVSVKEGRKIKVRHKENAKDKFKELE